MDNFKIVAYEFYETRSIGQAMNFIPAKKSSAEKIANCDSSGTATSNFFVERHAPIRPVGPRSVGVHLALRAAIEAYPFIFLDVRRSFRPSLLASVARSMQGAHSKKFVMLARSTHNPNSECGLSCAARHGISKPKSFERSSIRPRPILNSSDPSGSHPASETPRRETRIARWSLGSSGTEHAAQVSCL